MIKINSLKVEQLKKLLRDGGLTSTGTKSELVQRLSDLVQGDEIFVTEEMADSKDGTETVERKTDESMESMQAQVDSLRNMMTNLMSVLQTQLNTNNTQSATNAIPRNRETVLQDRPVVNACDRVRDMASLLPEFNPTSDTSLNSKQFITRVEKLHDAYKWPDNTLLFVVQQKLFGSAKLWIDSQEVFVSWHRFKEKFLQDFPCDDSVANTHIRMANMRHKNIFTKCRQSVIKLV